MAQQEGFVCHALSFDYGQRHRFELDAAERVATSMGAVEHRVVRLDLSAGGGFGRSALTDAIDVPKDRPASEDIPVTYVPGRNTIFLSVALGYAEVVGAFDIFIGVNAIDYSGYPDCRPAFVETIHAPLIRMTKEQIIRTGMGLGVDYGLTHSCYDPDDTGRACGRCDACRLRLAGFAAADATDPAVYQG
jgi:7-cyano-7-deazaguanine synthase